MPALTLTDAKNQLNIAGNEDDAELEAYVEGVNEVIEYYIGPIDDRVVTERWAPRGVSIALSQLPVVEVTGVAYVSDGSEAYAVDDLDVDPLVGTVRLKSGSNWRCKPVIVTYTAGRSGVAPKSANIAGRIIIQHLWETQRGADSRRPDLGSVDEPRPSPTYSIPRRAVQLLEPHMVGPVVA